MWHNFPVQFMTFLLYGAFHASEFLLPLLDGRSWMNNSSNFICQVTIHRRVVSSVSVCHRDTTVHRFVSPITKSLRDHTFLPIIMIVLSIQITVYVHTLAIDFVIQPPTTFLHHHLRTSSLVEEILELSRMFAAQCSSIMCWPLLFPVGRSFLWTDGWCHDGKPSQSGVCQFLCGEVWADHASVCSMNTDFLVPLYGWYVSSCGVWGRTHVVSDSF